MSESDSSSQNDELQRTALYDLHVQLGGKMVPFAGYSMPVQFKDGIIAEHLQTRLKAGLFDVSHMGQARLVGCSFDEVARVLETFVPGDILGLAPGQMRYTLLMSESGGIFDDLMVTRPADPNADGALFLVVNAATKQADFDYIEARLPEGFALERMEDRSLLALQGPKAAASLSALGVDVSEDVFMTARPMTLGGIACHVSRSGYTGEDGFEISVPNDKARALADELLLDDDVAPIGLGARDSLRLEAGLCLYGHDISVEITPVEANLKWVIAKRRRSEANFPGADIILSQLEHGCDQVRVGLRPKDRSIVREGAEIVNEEGREIGVVTSGTFGPSVGAPIAMGYVKTAFSAVGTELAALVRGKPRAMTVSPLPFVRHQYYRG